MSSTIWHDLWQVLLASLVLGAGLPLIYAFGIRALAMGTTQGGDGEAAVVARNPAGTALAAVCFLVVVAGVAVGLAYIIASGHGEQLSFSHGYPTFVPKD